MACLRRYSWVLCTVALACGPGGGSEGDGGSASDSSGATGSASDGSATSGASSGQSTTAVDGSSSGGGGECPPNAVYAVPGCEPAPPFAVEVTEEGCYEVCDNGDSTQCSEGACVRAWIDPCHDAPCDACGGESWICMAGEPLMPGFEAMLSGQDGCGAETFSLGAFAMDGNTMLTVSVGAGLTTMAQDTAMTQQQTFELPSTDVGVRASLGPGVAGNFCNDAPLGTALRVYEGISGTMDVTVEPPPMGSGFEDQGIATVVLTDVVLQQTSGAGETVDLPSFTFESVAIWCCPG